MRHSPEPIPHSSDEPPCDVDNPQEQPDKAPDHTGRRRRRRQGQTGAWIGHAFYSPDPGRGVKLRGSEKVETDATDSRKVPERLTDLVRRLGMRRVKPDGDSALSGARPPGPDLAGDDPGPLQPAGYLHLQGGGLTDIKKRGGGAAHDGGGEMGYQSRPDQGHDRIRPGPAQSPGGGETRQGEGGDHGVGGHVQMSRGQVDIAGRLPPVGQGRSEQGHAREVEDQSAGGGVEGGGILRDLRRDQPGQALGGEAEGGEGQEHCIGEGREVADPTRAVGEARIAFVAPGHPVGGSRHAKGSDVGAGMRAVGDQGHGAESESGADLDGGGNGDQEGGQPSPSLVPVHVDEDAGLIRVGANEGQEKIDLQETADR